MIGIGIWPVYPNLNFSVLSLMSVIERSPPCQSAVRIDMMARTEVHVYVEEGDA
jgi:hypothetical protein